LKGLHPVSESSLSEIALAMENEGVRYLAVGGLAVIAHGYVRATLDLDLVISLEPDNIVKGLRVLENLGYASHVPVKWEDFADEKIRNSWAKDKNMIVLQLINDQKRDTPVDVFIHEPFDFDSELEAANFHTLSDGVKMPVITKATLIRLKKEAARSKDLVDIEYLEKVF